jgi:uncharacterized protein
MSESEPSKVFLFDAADPTIQGAYEQARASFRYFWRELHWENRRIIRGLSMAAVKAPFSDGEDAEKSDEHPGVEHMWINEVRFDGRTVSGTVLNAPNWLKTVKQGDAARLPLAEISDWMYVIGDEVYGAYTVNLMRAKMDDNELREHDEAWGLAFGDPHTIRIVQEPKKPGFLKSLFSKPKPAVIGEHPMSENCAPTIRKQIADDPSVLEYRDDDGFMALHHEALGGNLAVVRVLLEAGADRNAVTNHGMTPLELAQTLRWEKVIALLRA